MWEIRNKEPKIKNIFKKILEQISTFRPHYGVLVGITVSKKEGCKTVCVSRDVRNHSHETNVSTESNFQIHFSRKV